MNILLINYEFPPLGGGAGNATKNIAREMALSGQSVLVVTTGFEGLPREQLVDGYKIIRVPSLRKRKDRSTLIEMLHFVWCAIRQTGPDISQFKPDTTVSFFAVPTGIFALYLKMKYKIPYILSLRGGDVPGFLPKNLKYHHILSAPLTRVIWKRSLDIVANSKGLQELAKKTAHRLGMDVKYIPNGVNDNEFFPDPEKASSLKLKLIFVGRLTEQKGVTFLIQAIQALKGAVQCDIVGDGPLRESLENEVNDRGLKDSITFHGWIARSELATFYQKADVFVLPSYEEGMPNVILEAMASGLAIVATDIGGNEELVDQGVNGFLYTDHSQLASLLQKFIDNPSLSKEFGLASASKSQTFSWKLVAEKYIQLCQNKK